METNRPFDLVGSSFSRKEKDRRASSSTDVRSGFGKIVIRDEESAIVEKISYREIN